MFSLLHDFVAIMLLFCNPLNSPPPPPTPLLIVNKNLFFSFMECIELYLVKGVEIGGRGGVARARIGIYIITQDKVYKIFQPGTHRIKRNPVL